MIFVYCNCCKNYCISMTFFKKKITLDFRHLPSDCTYRLTRFTKITRLCLYVSFLFFRFLFNLIYDFLLHLPQNLYEKITWSHWISASFRIIQGSIGNFQMVTSSYAWVFTTFFKPLTTECMDFITYSTVLTVLLLRCNQTFPTSKSILSCRWSEGNPATSPWLILS